MIDLSNAQKAPELMPEDILAGATSLPVVEGLAAQAFNDYYHKIRADVSLNLWQTIFYKGFSAATKIYETFRDNEPFQKRVGIWVQRCFGDVVRYNREERSQRFLEEALELVQANGLSKEGALALVEYTYGRPVGVVEQELGGVMVTLAALCDACELDMVKEGEVELARINDPAIMAKIQAKQATKPANSSLPGRTPITQEEFNRKMDALDAANPEPLKRLLEAGKFKIEAYNPKSGQVFSTLHKPAEGVYAPQFLEDGTKAHLFDTEVEAKAVVDTFPGPLQFHPQFYRLHFRVVPA